MISVKNIIKISKVPKILFYVIFSSNKKVLRKNPIIFFFAFFAYVTGSFFQRPTNTFMSQQEQNIQFSNQVHQIKSCLFHYLVLNGIFGALYFHQLSKIFEFFVSYKENKNRLSIRILYITLLYTRPNELDDIFSLDILSCNHIFT